MSDTPRTDSHECRVLMRHDGEDTTCETVPTYFARQLERELAALRQRVEALRANMSTLDDTIVERDNSLRALRQRVEELEAVLQHIRDQGFHYWRDRETRERIDRALDKKNG